MSRVSQARQPAAVPSTRQAAPKVVQFDLTKKARLDVGKVKSGTTFTVKLPPGKWKLGGLNGREMFEFRVKGEKKFMPLEQWTPSVQSSVELRAKGTKGLNLLGQLTFNAPGKKELFIEMQVAGGPAPKNEPIKNHGWQEHERSGGIGGGGSDDWAPSRTSSSIGGGGS